MKNKMNNSEKETSSAKTDEGNKINNKIVANVWWSFFWRYVLCYFLFIIGLTIFSRTLGQDVQNNVVFDLITLTLGIIVSIWAIKTILTKKYKNFEIKIVRR